MTNVNCGICRHDIEEGADFAFMDDFGPWNTGEVAHWDCVVSELQNERCYIMEKGIYFNDTGLPKK